MNSPVHTLAVGRYFEAPRWRDGCLWLVDSLARTVSRIVAESHGDCLSEFDVGADGVLTFHRRFAQVGEPDGICLDREGGVWIGAFKEDAVIRVDRDGHMTDRIALPGRGIACALGGEDRRSLFCISAQTTHEDLARGVSTSRVDMIRVSIPGAGHP